MSQTSRVYFSIVISSLTGARRIGRALESLQAQAYPADQYEIIVVDDGSTDRTSEVASQYGVRLIRHDTNRGIAASRNSGLAIARGRVYVCFDDDCQVPPDWLQRLARAYQQEPQALGIGSVIIPPARPKGLVTKFMIAAGSGNPTPLQLGQSKQPAARFWAYVRDQITPPQSKIGRQLYPVRHLNGATASFDITALRAVGGWNPNLHWMEDTDICARLSQHFPNRRLFAEPAAKIIHDPGMSLPAFVKRPFRRGPYNLEFYRSQHTIAPIFPFPLFWAFTVILCLWLSPFISLAAAIIVPQLLYGWWPIRAWQEHQPSYFMFPYLQLAEESATIAGLVRGYLTGTPRHDH